MDTPRNKPPRILPIVTGRRLFIRISFIVSVLSKKYPNDRYNILAILCSKDRTINMNIGINITSIFSLVDFTVDARKTDIHTRKLQNAPRIMASIHE